MRRTALFAAVFLLFSTSLSAAVLRKIGSLAVYRQGPSLTRLPDGRFLVAGGTSTAPLLELLSLDSGRAVSVPSSAMLPLPLVGHTATLLPEGEVLLVGGGHDDHGRGMFGSYGDRRVSLYRLDSLTALPELSEPREWHRTTVLADGRLLVTGGMTEDVGGFHYWHDSTSGAELLTATGTRLTAPMHGKRTHHTATLLRDGRVLVTGGGDAKEVEHPVGTAEIYDPATETWQLAGVLHTPRSWHTATLLPDGRVLLAGGNDAPEPTAEIFDPATNTFTIAADVGYRKEHAAMLLADGTVLLFGGSTTTVVYDPVTDSVVDSLELPENYSRYAAALLADGSVLLVGEANVFRYTRNVVSRRRAARH